MLATVTQPASNPGEEAGDLRVAALLYPFGTDAFDVDSGAAVPHSITWRANGDDSWSVQLPVTDSGHMTPTGMAWRVSQTSINRRSRTLDDIHVPVGGGVFSSLIETTPPSPVPLGAVLSVVAGAGVAVNSADPQHPVVSVGAGLQPFVWDQVAPATVWTIPHNLGREPAAVSVVDSAGDEVMGEIVQRTSANVVVLTFGAAFAGKAYIF